MCKENFCDDTIREIVEYSMNTVESLPRGDQARIDVEFLNVGTLMMMKDPHASRELIRTLAAQYTECLGPERGVYSLFSGEVQGSDGLGRVHRLRRGQVLHVDGSCSRKLMLNLSS
jgi:hypothetical protein